MYNNLVTMYRELRVFLKYILPALDRAQLERLFYSFNLFDNVRHATIVLPGAVMDDPVFEEVCIAIRQPTFPKLQ
jgi:hypothetical protein